VPPLLLVHGRQRFEPHHAPKYSGSLTVLVLAIVTEPPKIILYYRLRLSTWPLSNNKELLSHFRRVKPAESLTT
jgi:hypothetical protein